MKLYDDKTLQTDAPGCRRRRLDLHFRSLITIGRRRRGALHGARPARLLVSAAIAPFRPGRGGHGPHHSWLLSLSGRRRPLGSSRQPGAGPVRHLDRRLPRRPVRRNERGSETEDNPDGVVVPNGRYRQ